MNIFTALGLLVAILLLINKPLRNKYKDRLLGRLYKSSQVEFFKQFRRKSPSTIIDTIRLYLSIVFIGLMLWGSGFSSLTGIHDKSIMKPVLVLIGMLICLRTKENYQKVKQFLATSYKSIISGTYSIIGVGLFLILIGFCILKDATPIAILSGVVDSGLGIDLLLVIGIVPFVMFTAIISVLYLLNHTCYKLSYYSIAQLARMSEKALTDYEYPIDYFEENIKEKKYWLTLWTVIVFLLYYLIF